MLMDNTFKLRLKYRKRYNSPSSQRPPDPGMSSAFSSAQILLHTLSPQLFQQKPFYVSRAAKIWNKLSSGRQARP
jgi:hypothetical protein